MYVGLSLLKVMYSLTEIHCESCFVPPFQGMRCLKPGCAEREMKVVFVLFGPVL